VRDTKRRQLMIERQPGVGRSDRNLIHNGVGQPTTLLVLNTDPDRFTEAFSTQTASPSLVPAVERVT